MKVVTRRPPGEDVLRDFAILQRTLNALRGNALVPRRVYRVSSHEEADAWMSLQIAATPSLESRTAHARRACPARATLLAKTASSSRRSRTFKMIGFPAPVASLRARRASCGFALLFAFTRY